MALLFIVLVLGMLSMGTLSALAINSLNGFLDATSMNTSQIVRAKVMGCLDEAFIQIQKTNTYAPATITTSNVTCSLTVTTPSFGQRLLIISLTDQNITRSTQANVIVSPFSVTQVNEP